MSVSPIHTRIWQEEAEADNPFATRSAHCHGYDVYGRMLGRAGWADMVYLLFRGEAPTREQSRLLETLAVALANPGPREPSVYAAMCGGIGGSPAAANLMAALAVGAGASGGAQEVFRAMTHWAECGDDPAQWMAVWLRRVTTLEPLADDTWPQPEHAAGFDPNGATTPTIVLQALEALSDAAGSGARLHWLQDHRTTLESACGLPLAMTGVAAAAYADLGLRPEQGEMLHLLLRLPGAAVHALEQWEVGFKRFPFPPVELLDDPATKAAPHEQEAA